MPAIDVTESAKAYLDALAAQTGDGFEDLTYSQVIRRLRDRSYNAAHGGGEPPQDADEMEITDEYGSVNQHTVKKEET